MYQKEAKKHEKKVINKTRFLIENYYFLKRNSHYTTTKHA
jgi:hypothetical protein